MTILENKKDIGKIRDSGRVVRGILSHLKDVIKEGITTAEIDGKVEEWIINEGGEPAFKGYKGYPATTCISVNDVVVHGIPSKKRILKNGDIVSVDVGVKKNGFYTDAAATYIVGQATKEKERLISVTRESLYNGIKEAIEGNRVSDISNAVQTTAEGAGYRVVRAFVGHGTGTELHELPEVPNWGERGKGPKLKEGLILAIEPMVNAGTSKIKVLPDGWTAVTEDGKLSAHFEHTVMVGKEKAEILT